MSDTLEQLTASVEGLRDLLASFDAGPVDEWADGALEAYATLRADYTGTGGAQSVTVVTGTGGPHVEVTCEMRGGGSFRAEGWWGSDHVVRRGVSDVFEAWCDDYVAGLSYDNAWNACVSAGMGADSFRAMLAETLQAEGE